MRTFAPSGRFILHLFVIASLALCAAAFSADEPPASPRPDLDTGSWWWGQYQAHGQRSPQWDELVQTACTMIENGWAGATVQTLREARMKGCECPVVLLMMGYIGPEGGMTWDESAELIRSAESAFRDAPPLRRLRAEAFGALAGVYRDSGRHREAAEALREAVSVCPAELTQVVERLRRQLSLEEEAASWEQRVESVAARIESASPPTALEFHENVLGVVEYCARNSVSDLDQALRISRAAVRTWPEDPRLATYHVNILQKLRFWEEAEESGLHAIELAEAGGDNRVLFDALNALHYTLVAHSHNDRTVEGQRRLRKYDRPGLSHRMMAIAQEVGDDELLYIAYHARARNPAEKEDADEPVLNYKKALEIALRNDWPRRIDITKYLIGMTYAVRNRLEESEAWSKEAGIRVNLYVPIQRGQWRDVFDGEMSRVLATDGETLRQPNQRLMVSSVGWNARDAYDYAIIAALHTDRAAEAVEVSERFHNRTLGTILGARLDEPRTHIIAKHEKEQADVGGRMERLRAQLALAGEDPDTAASIQRDLDVQGADMAALASEIKAEEMEIRNARMPQHLALADMQELLDPDTALVMYQVTWASFVEDGMIAVITREGCHAVLQDQLTIGRHPGRVIMARIQAYLDVATDPNPTPERKAELAEEEAGLFDLLVAPARDDIAGFKHIVIVPCGPLQQLPIHLLRNRSGWSLADDHAVSYAQSVGTLKFCLARNRKIGRTVTIVADPALPEIGSRLRFALPEAEAVRNVFPNAELLTGNRATETAVKRALPSADLLHFACHGLLDSNYPMKSALALAPDADNDGLLTAREICDQPVKAGLVVLSACNSGAGALSLGCIEMIGMSRAWLLAGAPSIVVSLWKIDDRATSELMAEFYGNLKTMSRAEALRQAQLTLRNRYESPYYWGAFVLYGDYR